MRKSFTRSRHGACFCLIDKQPRCLDSE